MYSCEEQIVALKEYLRKLLYIIEKDASFTFMEVKIVSKKRIDDIVCCIEASFPEIYKEQALKKSNRIRSYQYFQKLLRAVNNTLVRGSSLNLVYYKQAQKYISYILTFIDSDIKEILNNS